VRIVREGGQARGFMKIERRSEGSYAPRLIGVPAGWSEHEAIEKRYRDAEVTRLLYVAATRARDLVVVGRCARAGGNKAWGEFASFLSGCPELAIPPVPAEPHRPLPDVSPATRAQAAHVRHERTTHLRQPSWAITRVTDEAHHHGPSRRIRQELADEPSVPASAGPDDASLLHETSSHRADAGYAWGLLIHGLLEHAMRHKNASRTDLERLALWLTVETPDLRPHISSAVDVVQGVSKAPFWSEANAAGERHVEVPYAVRHTDSSGLPTVVRGVIDLVYRPSGGWQFLDYKTDQVVDAASLVGRYRGQIEQYADAWAQVTATTKPAGAIYSVRTGHVLTAVAAGEQNQG
jgi:ATP-dependent helicase/nuclease subunit A